MQHPTILPAVTFRTVIFNNESLALSPSELFSVALRRASGALGLEVGDKSSSLSVVSCSMSVWSSSSSPSSATLLYRESGSGAGVPSSLWSWSWSAVGWLGPWSAWMWGRTDVSLAQRSMTAQEVRVSTNVSVVDASSESLVLVRLVHEILSVPDPRTAVADVWPWSGVVHDVHAGQGESVSVLVDGVDRLLFSGSSLPEWTWRKYTVLRR
jgi:hypothetical protein